MGHEWEKLMESVPDSDFKVAMDQVHVKKDRALKALNAAESKGVDPADFVQEHFAGLLAKDDFVPLHKLATVVGAATVVSTVEKTDDWTLAALREASDAAKLAWLDGVIVGMLTAHNRLARDDA